MRNKIIAIMMSMILCLTMTGCGENEIPEETSSSESAASVSNGKLKSDSVVIAVGKTTVTYDEFLAYCYFMKNPYAGMIDDEVWNYNKVGEEGKTIGQEALEAVLRLMIQVKVICKEAAVENIALETDEKEQASYNAKTVCDKINEAEKAANGINTKMVTNIFQENKLAQKMYNIQLGKVDAHIQDNQLKASRVQFIYRKAKDDNRNEVKKKVDEIYRSVTEKNSNFYALAKEYSEAAEVETIIGQGDKRANVANVAVHLKAGQTSDIISEKDGFYIIHCVQPNSKEIQEQYKNQLILEKQTQAFQKAYKNWAEKFEVRVSKSLLASEK